MTPRSAGNGAYQGLALGGLGVLGFSFTLPATRVAVSQLDPTIVSFGRVLVAAVVGGVLLAATKSPLPSWSHVRRLAVVAAGVVIGFPLFTTLALRQLSSADGAVIVGLLPVATAMAAVLRGGERPSARFWLAAAAGAVSVVAFAVTIGAGLSRKGGRLRPAGRRLGGRRLCRGCESRS